ncbi:helix-turn-helix domain-containing protein [Pseudomonas alkylphenolica]|uniref:helix-turn-helix domain-containing protein n=1 Tax=Pseudomonas alkylphenolica TaxID=237609 RepID=UPI0018D750AD|nr:helix-turn-helix domain-containing protein [Pseudomonas alkylphenolica]MBH3428264.1 helix-turn-helix domain-containing protein [Pseudomonas alkylphenolica]
MSTNGFAAVLSRMKLITGTTTDAELSYALKISPQTLSTWKGRNSTPYSLCIDLAVHYNVSLDWLLLGNGPQRWLTRNPDATATNEQAEDWETQLIDQLRTLGPLDRQAIAIAVKEKQHIRQLERQVEALSKQLHITP